MNKKKFLTTLSIAAVAIVSGYGGMKAYQSHAGETNKLLALNVEALANDEYSNKTKIKCYTSFVYEAGASVVDCTTCKIRNNQSDAWYNIHDYCWR